MSGDVIRRRREELGIKRAEAARRSGVSAETWKNVEDGGRTYKGQWVPANPDAATMAAIDKVLEWEAGSTREVLAGRQPTPLRQAGDPVAQAVLELAEVVRQLQDEVRALRSRLGEP